MLKEGIYEEIIKTKLKDILSSLNINYYQIEKQNIDVEEARKMISSYILGITRKA